MDKTAVKLCQSRCDQVREDDLASSFTKLTIFLTKGSDCLPKSRLEFEKLFVLQVMRCFQTKDDVPPRCLRLSCKVWLWSPSLFRQFFFRRCLSTNTPALAAAAQADPIQVNTRSFSEYFYPAFSCSLSSWTRSRSMRRRKKLPTVAWLMPPPRPRRNFRWIVTVMKMFGNWRWIIVALKCFPPSPISILAGRTWQGCQSLWWRPGHWHDCLPRPEVRRPRRWSN